MIVIMAHVCHSAPIRDVFAKNKHLKKSLN